MKSQISLVEPQSFGIIREATVEEVEAFHAAQTHPLYDRETRLFARPVPVAGGNYLMETGGVSECFAQI